MDISEQVFTYATKLMAHIRIMFAYLDTYKALCTSKKSFHDTMSQAPIFFNVIEKSIVSSLMIDLCKLFEDSSTVLSVKKLYSICEQNQKLFPKYRTYNGIETDIPFTLSKTLDLAKQDFEDNKKVISNLKKQRNTLWAHHDKRYILDPSQIEDSYPIKWQEIEHLLQFASDFTNSVISNFSSSIELPFFNNADACFDNVQTVLSLMENGMNKRSNTNG